MDITRDIIGYYKGERLEALLLAGFGIAAIGIALILWQNHHHNHMLKGLFYPIAILGLLTFLLGGFGVYNNGERLEKLPVRYADNPAGFVHGELERFDGKGGVNAWWVPLKITWALLVVLGMVLTFATGKEWISGLAIGLIVVGAMGFVIDGFAHQRAKAYTAALKGPGS